MTRANTGTGDPWGGFAIRESHEVIDPEAFRADTYKGAVWRFADVGHPIAAVLEVIGVTALIVGIVVGFQMFWATVLLVVVVGIAMYNHGHAVRWAEEHNARVEAALSMEAKPKPKRPAGKRR